MHEHSMALGEADGEVISLRPIDQVEHILILGGKSFTKPRKVLFKALECQVANGGGILYMQVERDNTYNFLKDSMAKHDRAGEFYEINNKHEVNIDEILAQSMLKNKVIYVEISKLSGKMQEKLLKAVKRMSDLQYKHNTENRYTPKRFMVAVTQFERFAHEEWMRIKTFAQRNNLILVTLIDSFTHVTELMQFKPYYTTLEHIISGAKHKLVFNQGDVEQNEIINRYFHLPIYKKEVGLKGWYNQKFKQPSLIDEMTNNQFLYMKDDELFVLDLVDVA